MGRDPEIRSHTAERTHPAIASILARRILIRIGAGMQKKLTITVDAEVYNGLHSVIGRRRISRFINDLARPHVVGQDLSAGYAAMAADEAREAEAATWTEELLNDVGDEPNRDH
jgi:hypothetical protein